MPKENENEFADIVKGMEDIRKLAEDSTAESKQKLEAISNDTAAKIEAIQAKDLEKEAQLKDVQSKVDMMKKDYDELYKKANKPESKSGLYVNTAYHKELSKYLRKGVAPSSDTLDEVAQEFVEKTMYDADQRALDNAKYNMLDEQGPDSGKGFYVMDDIKTMRVGNNPDGGYLAPTDRRTDVSVGRIFETSPMRALASIITTGNSDVELVIDDNESASGGWVGEEGTRSDTDQAQIGLLKIAVHEQFAQPKATQKMLDDAAFNVESWLSEKTNDILTRTENTAFVSGDGSQKPKGFLSYDAWATAGTYERHKIEQVNSGTSGVVVADGLIDLQNSLIEEYQANARFLLKRATFANVAKLKDGNGQYLLNAVAMSQGFNMTLLGKPIVFADDMPAVAANALSIAYGDFGKGYTIVDRIGIRVLRDPYTSKPYIKFYTTKRVGGAVTNFEAIKIQKLAA